MVDDTIRKLLEQQSHSSKYAENLNLAARLNNQYSAAQRLLEETSRLRQAMEEENRHRDLMRMAAGQIEGLKSNYGFELNSAFQRELEQIKRLSKENSGSGLSL